ncbi:hypothetical protein HOK68_02665 [Candidatus Woesearchaeota archaeon]|jgi:hypothetical protein|nr:hypothetical protein [Candidatus Woesearchaeota archaeon]MBT4387100.1 hypothetical protein [Candidatus Woesearchaeota archaeon]MBT4596143.1 hypothetical protein [Candidatus Woesearchaeota archaeon]MBT5741634.1 hypothetical protein [Candidatus Woesearchaeota archaeon]MBT6505655.1 hypothetical protein [Candidatus Woesearchaeota archaeon]
MELFYWTFLALLIYILIGHITKHMRVYCDDGSHWDIHLHSFASGVLFAALFFKFFFKIYTNSNVILNIFIAIITFTIFYGLNHFLIYHKYTIKKFHKIAVEFKILRFLLDFFQHFVIGGIFGHIVITNNIDAIFLIIPLLFVKLISSIEKADILIKNKKTKETFEEYFMSFITLAGFIIISQINILEIYFYFALAFVTGGIFYSIISQIFSKRKVNIFYMIVGEIIYASLMFI